MQFGATEIVRSSAQVCARSRAGPGVQEGAKGNLPQAEVRAQNGDQADCEKVVRARRLSGGQET